MGERSAESRRRVVAALLVAVACALIASLGFFFFRDNFSTHYPLKAISAAAWRAGAIPWWNLTDGGGQPLAGNPNALTFYPDNILYLLLPAHVAFNLHFLLHLVVGWLAMRALTRSSFGATLWVLSGAALSACAFYNLIPAIALIPLAFLAMERRSAAMLALSFGLLALAGEPVTLLATALACAILSRGWRHIVVAVPVAIAIALPQVLAYREIAREVERARGYSAQTVLNASLDPRRLLELVAGPFLKIDAPHLFPSLLIGLIAIPALVRRSRYTTVAAVMLFFALGRFNPAVRVAVESLPWMRIVRYPEKFALPLCAALVVLAAMFFAGSKRKPLWLAVTFLPLLAWGVVTAPLDWWFPYAQPPTPPARALVLPRRGGETIDREAYRRFAHDGMPLFGASLGLRYVLNRSGDGMHSTLSRIVAERYAATGQERYLAIARDLPMAMIVPQATGVRSVNEAVELLERTAFDVSASAIAPQSFDGFTSDPAARVISYRELPDRIEIGVAAAPGPALLFVNQSYFTAWDTGGLATLPLDIDRLGVMLPPGTQSVTLRFGRQRTLVTVFWVVSSVLLVALLLAIRVEMLDRRAGQVERAADEDDGR